MSPLICTPPDGRRLAWAEYGDPLGVPVVTLHGTQGGRLNGQLHHDRYARQGLRVLAVERPGYGASDPAPGRTVRSFADDVLVFLDAAGLESVLVVGGSGGGPHALAIGATAPDRVRAVGVLVGAAPLEPAEIAQQVAFNQAVLANVGDPDALRELLEPARMVLREQGVAALLTDAPESDRAQWEQYGDAMTATLRSALEPGVDGMVDDYVALWAAPWGFEPADVTVPALWAHGRDDHNVPLAAARRVVDKLPDCRLVTWTEVGHAPSPELLAEFHTALLARALGAQP